MHIERRVSAWWALPACVISAVLFFFGTGFHPVAGLAALAPLPLFLLAPRVSAAVAGLAAFFGYLLSTIGEFDFYAHSHDVPLPIGMAISAGFSVALLLTVTLFRALVLRGRVLLAAVGAPALWTAILLAVSFNPMGVVGTLATAQTDLPVLLQTASVTGALGVEFLVLLAPAAIGALCAPGVHPAARMRTGTVVVLLFAVVLGGGALRLASTQHGPVQRVALIADDAPGWAPLVETGPGRATLDSYVDSIAALPSDVDLVVLPEAAFGTRTEAGLRAITGALRAVARERRVTVVAGVQRYAGQAKYNTALTFPANGDNPAGYLKWHDTASKLGHDLTFVPNAPSRTGVVICADVDFRDPTAPYALAGSRTLAIPAADETTNGWQHGRTALLRGVENGQSVLWAGRIGTLLAADGTGRVLAERPSGRFATVFADLPAGPGATPYSRFGDWFGWLCVALSVVALLATLRRRRR